MPKFICSIKDANNRYGMADIIEASGTENAKAQFKKAYNMDFLQSALLPTVQDQRLPPEKRHPLNAGTI